MAKEWPAYLPKEFLFCFSLQAGVVGCCTIGLTLSVITLLCNIYQENEYDFKIQAVQYILLGFYLIIMLFGYIIGFLASFWENSSFVKCAGGLIAFGTIIFTIYGILSFIPRYHLVKYLCPGRRCPDQHWLVVDRWRKYMFPKQYPPYIDPWFGVSFPFPKREYDKRISNTSSQSESALTNKTSETNNVAQNEMDLRLTGINKQVVLMQNNKYKRNKTTKFNVSELKELTDEEYASEILYVIISFIYMLMIILYLVYSVLAFFAFAKQLKNE